MDRKVVLTAAIVVAFLLSSSILVTFYNPEEEKVFACMDYDSFLDRVDATKCERFDGDCFLAQGMDMQELKRVAGIE